MVTNDTALYKYPSELLVDTNLILSRVGSKYDRHWQKYDCLEKGFFKIISIFLRVVVTSVLFVFLGIESSVSGVIGLAKWGKAISSGSYVFSPGIQSVKEAIKKFFVMLVCPCSLFFPETILMNFASDEIIMREPCKKALAQFEKWDEQRQLEAWNYAIEHQEKIDPAFFKILSERDVGNVWKQTLFQLFYQQFSIINDRRCTQKMEGFPASKWRIPDREICRSINKWLETEKGISHKSRMKEVVELLQTSIETDTRGEFNLKENDIGKEEWRYCPSGFIGHANAFIVTPYFIAKVDTGMTKDKGIKLYRITKENTDAKKTLFRELHSDSRSRKMDRKQQKEVFHQVKKKLELRRVAMIEWKQKSGSCSYTASLVAAFAILVLKELHHKGDVSSVGQAELNAAIKKVYPIFDQWNKWHRAESFKMVYPQIKKELKDCDAWLDVLMLTDCLEEKDFLTLEEIVKLDPVLGLMTVTELFPGLDETMTIGKLLEHRNPFMIPSSKRQIIRKIKIDFL